MREIKWRKKIRQTNNSPRGKKKENCTDAALLQRRSSDAVTLFYFANMNNFLSRPSKQTYVPLSTYVEIEYYITKGTGLDPLAALLVIVVNGESQTANQVTCDGGGGGGGH